MATVSVTIPPSTWGLAGTGPCFVDIRNFTKGFVATGSTIPVVPAKNIDGKHDISRGRPFSYGGADQVYVWNNGSRNMIVAVTS